MAKCNFSIEFSGGPESLINRATQGISSVKGKFTGDVNNGAFKVPTPLGDIEGSYTIEGSAINISVQDKPMLLSCNRIETELRKFMA